MKFNKLSLLFIAFSIAFTTQSKAGDPFALWLTLNSPSYKLSDNHSSKSHFEMRFPEAEELSYYRFSQKFYTKLNDNWTLGSHPVFENSKGGSGWKSTYRLDMELNPAKISLGANGPQLSMRNRWELRWKEGNGSTIFHRIRQQSKVTWKLANGPFSSYSLGNEIFFEEDKGKLTMNRFYPIMLSKKHGDSLKGSYFLMYQSKRAGLTSDWNGQYIAGASLSF